MTITATIVTVPYPQHGVSLVSSTTKAVRTNTLIERASSHLTISVVHKDQGSPDANRTAGFAEAKTFLSEILNLGIDELMTEDSSRPGA